MFLKESPRLRGDINSFCISFILHYFRFLVSLVNIYKELATNIEGFKTPSHGNLTGWARQGVLLLNACLTVKAHNANSHQGKGWEELTDSVIKWISSNLNGVIGLNTRTITTSL